MDIDEWEYLPDHGYLDFNEVAENQIFFGKRNTNSDPKTTTTTTVLDMNYFCKSPKSKEEKSAPWNHHHQQRVPLAKRQQLVHVPIQLEPRFGHTPDGIGGLLVEQSTDNNKDHHVGVETEQQKKISSVLEQPVDQDTVSQVFFKIKETNEFVDMKMDSPKSGSRGYLFPPLIDAGGGAMRFEDKGEALVTSPRMKIEKEMIVMDCDEKEEEEEGEKEELFEDSSDGENFNLWKWGLTGVGAIFSFGVAAATICVLFFGTHQRNKLQQDQKIRFQIYTDDKRLKQVVQHATKLNEAISAVRGVPLSRAHITYGGYYDGL